MANDFDSDVREFIFNKVDSVELLEVLLFLRAHRDRTWDSQGISEQLRSSPESVDRRLNSLLLMGLATKNSNREFSYLDTNESIISRLAEAYRTHKYRVLELIFSPTKKARSFADAFVISKPGSTEGDENG